MSGYQRLITYLFRYEKNTRKENCGFAKIERRQNVCRMDIHIKKFPGERMQTDVCFYFREGEYLFSVPIGKIAVKKHMSDGVFRFDARAVGEAAIQFEQIRGIVIPVEKDCVIASQWDDESADWSRLDVKKEESQEPSQYQEKSDSLYPETDADLEKTKEETPVETEEEAASFPEKISDNSEEESIMELQEISDQAIQDQEQSDQETGIFSSAWRYLKEQYEELFFTESVGNVRAVRIDLKDFRYFPRCFWYLRSSRFLLHGYFNYGKLLFGYVQGTTRWFIGVPGIYEEREQELAVILGFPDFWSGSEEENTTRKSGYWIRYLTE